MTTVRLRCVVWGVAVLCYVAGVTARSSPAAVGPAAVHRFTLPGIGLVLDLQGAGAGELALREFRWVMRVHDPVWILGVVRVLFRHRWPRRLLAAEGILVPPLRVVFRQRLLASLGRPPGAPPAVKVAAAAEKEAP